MVHRYKVILEYDDLAEYYRDDFESLAINTSMKLIEEDIKAEISCTWHGFDVVSVEEIK